MKKTSFYIILIVIFGLFFIGCDGGSSKSRDNTGGGDNEELVRIKDSYSNETITDFEGKALLDDQSFNEDITLKIEEPIAGLVVYYEQRGGLASISITDPREEYIPIHILIDFDNNETLINERKELITGAAVVGVLKGSIVVGKKAFVVYSKYKAIKTTTKIATFYYDNYDSAIWSDGKGIVTLQCTGDELIEHIFNYAKLGISIFGLVGSGTDKFAASKDGLSAVGVTTFDLFDTSVDLIDEILIDAIKTQAIDGLENISKEALFSKNTIFNIKFTFAPRNIVSTIEGRNQPSFLIQIQSVQSVVPSQHTVTATAGTGGSFTPSSLSISSGSTASFTVSPNSGYTQSSSVGGNCPSGSWSGNTYTTGSVTNNCSVNFSFNQSGHTVTASAGIGGSVSPSSWSVGSGSTASFTVDANTGYTRNEKVGGTCPVGSWSGSTYTTGTVSGDCSVSVSFSQNAIPILNADFAANKTLVAPGEAVQFTDLSTGEIYEWLWFFGDGGTSGLHHPNHEYIKSGTYSVTLTVSAPYGSHTKTKSGYINVGTHTDTLSTDF